MNHNVSPKSEFLKDPMSVQNHHHLIENPMFRRHLDIALAEMQRRSSAGTDPNNGNACAASHLRMLGAQDFIEILLNLAEQMQPGVRVDSANLPGNVSSIPRKN